MIVAMVVVSSSKTLAIIIAHFYSSINISKLVVDGVELGDRKSVV